MKLKEFIEKLSELDQDLEVLVYLQDPYEDNQYFDSPVFDGDYGKNIEVVNDHLYIGY